MLLKGLRNVLAEWAPLDPAAATLADRLQKDAQLRTMVSAIARACLRHHDRFTISCAVDEYMARSPQADRHGIGMRLGAICKTFANQGEILRLVDTGAASAPVYEFANHLTPQFLLMAARLSED